MLNSAGNVAFVHRLKCWAESFDAIVSGAKRAEVRVEDDRKFRPGDVLDLVRTDREGKMSEPRVRLVIEILHVERHAGPLDLRGAPPDDGGLGLPKPIAVLSLAHRFERHTEADAPADGGK